MRVTMPLIYEDAEIIAVDKPAGIPSIPERYEAGCVSALEILRDAHPGILAVHRIDKDTSGVLLFCKTEAAFRVLSGRFSRREVRKVYGLLAAGRPGEDGLLCEEPLRLDGDRRHRTVVHRDGKPSVTRFRVLERFRTCSLLEAVPETGRTHQIRVHLAHLGYPILCDGLYGSEEPLLLSSFKRGYRPAAGGERPLLARLALHALSVEFLHPSGGQPLRIEAPLPKDMAAALAQLRKFG